MWVYTTQGISQKVWNVDPSQLSFSQEVIKSKLTQEQLNNPQNLVTLNEDLKKTIENAKSSNYELNYDLSYIKDTVKNYNEAGNWTGVIFAAYSVFAALFSLAITPLANKYGRRNVYVLSLILGGIGLFSMLFIKDKNLLFLPMIGVGISWAAILALPYAILSSKLPPKQTGVYMGIFNATITIPQIAAGLLGGVLLSSLGGTAINMVALAGVSMAVAGIAAFLVIKE